MSHNSCGRFAFALLCAPNLPLSALADLVASVNAADVVYDNSWQVGDNGRSGFSAWCPINCENGSGDGERNLRYRLPSWQVRTALVMPPDGSECLAVDSVAL
jgi:hypothetical protein